MIYDSASISAKIKAILPIRWFGEDTPILDSVLNALSAGWVSLFVLLDYTSKQTRIGTATGMWLDLVARDYFEQRVKRRQREPDEAFRNRINNELQRDRCTRAAIYDLLLSLTGRRPIIFEPTNPYDTGCYGSSLSPEGGRTGYGTTGGWGNLSLPFQAFIRAFRPDAPGVAMINGWGGSIGGYGNGLSAYINQEMNLPQASDAEIFQGVSRTAPAGAIIWMSIEP